MYVKTFIYRLSIKPSLSALLPPSPSASVYILKHSIKLNYWNAHLQMLVYIVHL